MAKKRVKPANLIPIKDLAQADAALQEIAAIKRALTNIEAGLNETIDAAKAEADCAAEAHKKRLDALTNGLLAFAEFNKDELFVKKKSVELVFGLLGFRKSTKVKPKPKQTWKTVIEKLKEFNFQKAIRVKESPDKDVLRGWPDERLDMIGVKKAVADEFWFEVKEEEIKSAAL